MVLIVAIKVTTLIPIAPASQIATVRRELVPGIRDVKASRILVARNVPNEISVGVGGK